MTEPADQPLLAEQNGTAKSPAKKRVAKPRAATSKAAKPRTRKSAKADAEVPPESVQQPELPVAEPLPSAVEESTAAPALEPVGPTFLHGAEPALVAPPELPEISPDLSAVAAPPPLTRALPTEEEWRPSSAKRETNDQAESSPKPEPATPPAADAEVTLAPAAEAAPVSPEVEPIRDESPVRERPVYIPRHVARQMEEQARGGAPMQVPPPMEPRQDRYDSRQDRHDSRSGRHERQDARHDPRQDSQQELPPPREDEIGSGDGIVEVSGKGFGFLRDPKRSFAQHPADVFVTPELCRRFNLRDGQWVKGQTRRGQRGSQLFHITEINGEDPEKAATLPVFDELTVVSPDKRIRLETVPDRYTTRIIDLMCPIGKGQRGLIVAPPRTGKTTLLQHIAAAVVKNHPEVTLIILLVDERPEEVTEIKRTVPTAEIMASSNDSDLKSHTRIAQLAIERAKRLVESGKDAFVLLDSITRVGRAFNNAMGGGGRTMSGGIDARALEIPRKLFAAARNTEEAGSLTIIATALIDTGSRMDELIFQEFKGTGNMELVLDRKISDQRTYPAVDIFQSGTRREELLVPEADLHKINVIRRGLAGHKPVEALERLLFFVKKFPTNSQMLREIPG